MRLVLVSSVAVLLLLRSVPLSAQAVADASYFAPDSTRVLRQSVEMPASAGEVWQALTTTEGIQSWAVPVAHVDFRIGGIWESSYRLDGRIGDPANIKNRFLSYVPLHMLSMQVVQSPPDFPHHDLLPEIFTVFELEELGADRTRVTVSMVGFRTGAAYDTLYHFFERGNAWSLEQLQARFVTGPVDWRRALAPSTNQR